MLLLVWWCAVKLLLLTWVVTACEVPVGPPAHIDVSDPGYLGLLSISWTQSPGLQNLTDCTARYQLHYYDTYEELWRTVRTFKLNFDAQFDLEKPVKVRLSTLVKCLCTEDKETQGKETERVFMPEHTGLASSRIQDFHCIYYGKEFMTCTWETGIRQPPNSEYFLYYWHKDMKITQECPEYVVLSEVRRGCVFHPEALTEFTAMNLCVNGSSSDGPLEPAFFSFEVQNLVKPKVISSLEISEIDGVFNFIWAPPTGHLPKHCFEYEVERNTVMANGSELRQRTFMEDTFHTIMRAENMEKTCFRVRSKVSTYCADAGFWSDWSETACTGVSVRNFPYLVAVVIISVATLVFCLSFWFLKKFFKKTDNKDSLYALYKHKVNDAMPTILGPVL